MTPRLYCTRLSLTDFRSHASLDLALDARPVCLFGANGAGKTNILEALTMLAPGRGLRSANLTEVARIGGAQAGEGARPWAVSARLVADGETVSVGAGAERTETGMRRIARIDGRAATTSELARVVRLSWLTPAMDRIFAGAAGDRRRFFDRLVLGRAPEHGQSAAGYERAMRERQRLLNDDVNDTAWLAALEREMAGHGCAMAAARLEMLERLRVTIEERPDGAFPKARIGLEGALEAAFAEGRASADIEDEFIEILARGRRRDAAAGRAIEGPHRSDLLVRHAPKDMPADQCSTGEQKALLLGLILAHGRALADDPDAGPALLLLDEAAAHLDPDRRAALYDELLALPGQAWLTGTEAGLFEAFGTRAMMVGVGGGD